MRKLLLAILCACLAQTAGARELVVTLQSGERMAFHLSTSDDVTMTQTAEQVILAGVPLQRADIKEMRIFQQLPEGAIAVGIGEVQKLAPALPMDGAVYDLNGRRVADNVLEMARRQAAIRAGVYLINNKKVVIR